MVLGSRALVGGGVGGRSQGRLQPASLSEPCVTVKSVLTGVRVRPYMRLREGVWREKRKKNFYNMSLRVLFRLMSCGTTNTVFMGWVFTGSGRRVALFG